MSQIGQSLLGITWYVFSRSQIGQSYTSWYVSAKFYLLGLIKVLAGMSLRHLDLVSNFKVPAGTPLSYPKLICFIEVLADAFL